MYFIQKKIFFDFLPVIGGRKKRARGNLNEGLVQAKVAGF
jgi:hypothetical protein